MCFTLQNTGSCNKEQCPYRHVAAVEGGKGSQNGKNGKNGKSGKGGRGGQPVQDSKDGEAAVNDGEAAVVDDQQRGKSPPRREQCEAGLDCKKSDCPLWHPSPGKVGKDGQKHAVAGSWFMDVDPTGSAAVHSLLATSDSTVSESSASSVRALRWGSVTTKIVKCTPEGEEAPECGELSQHDHAASQRLPRAPSAMRGQPPKVLKPFPEMKDRLLTKSKTRWLYHNYRRKTFSPIWLRLTGDEKRYHVVANGCSWVARLNRFFASCLHWGLPIKGYMLQEWNRITKSDAPIKLKDRTRLPVPSASSATTPPECVAAPVAEPAADAPVPLKQIDMRSVKTVCGDELASGVYLIDENAFNCVDTGSTIEAMTGPGNPAVYDIEELLPADRLSVVGVGGGAQLKQRGKVKCCVPAEVVHAKPELERLMREYVQDAACGKVNGALCYYFELQVYINPMLKSGLTLMSCGHLVHKLGWSVTLDAAPGGSYGLSPADTVTGTRLRLPMRFGRGTGHHHDMLLTVVGLEMLKEHGSAVKSACETWEVVRMLHQRAQEELSVRQRQRLAEIEEGPYSLYGYCG